jgi:hypothetical protein
MAAGMGQVKGLYNQKVSDPDKDQASKKFGGHGGGSTIKDSGKHSYNQKSGSSTDSKDSKI